MRTNIIRIGNSQGIRIPKVILEQSHIGTEVDLEFEENKIVISSVSLTRTGWSDKFRLMAKSGDDKLIDQPSSNHWDEDEWQW